MYLLSLIVPKDRYINQYINHILDGSFDVSIQRCYANFHIMSSGMCISKNQSYVGKAAVQCMA